jgi:putative SOS response-associated peptidase YedK
MWNLYSIATNQDAIRRLFGVAIDSAGNLPSLASVFPEQEAPVVRNQSGGRELVKICGALPPKFGRPPVANIRNTSSPHLRGWLKPEYQNPRPAIRTWFGSQSTTSVRCSRSPAYGPRSKAIAAQSQNRCPVRT